MYSYRDFVVKKGSEEGVRKAASALNNARMSIVNNARSKKSHVAAKKLEKQLNGIFYPKINKDEDNKTLQKINEIIKKSYEQMGKELVDNFDINNSSTYYFKNFQSNHEALENLQVIIKNQKSADYEYSTRTLKKVEAEIKEIEMWLNGGGDISNILQQVNVNLNEDKLNNLKAELQSVIKSFEGKEATMITKGLKDKTELMEKVNDLHSIYMGLVSIKCSGRLSTTDVGDIFEIALAAASSLVNQTAENITDEFISDFVSSIVATASGTGSSAWKGKQAGGRDGFAVSLNIPDKKFKKGTYTVFDKGVEVTNKNTGKKETKQVQHMKITLPDGSTLDFEYKGGINTISPTSQGKIDVEYNYQLNDTVEPLRISAKNWGRSGSHGFNSSDLLSILSNSLKVANKSQEILDIYTMALQHPLDETKYSLSSKIDLAVKKITVISIVADILMGLSQKQGYANLAVLNLKGEKRIKVIDIIEELNKFNNGAWPSRGKHTQVSDYDPQEIWRQAREIKKFTLYGHWMTADSVKYYRAVRNILKSQSVTVKYTG